MPVWFKNLQLYRLDKEWTLPAGELEEKLAARPLLPCSAMSLESRGWVSPRGDEQLVYGVEKHLMLALGTEQKLLPSSVVNDAVKQRAAEFEKEKGFKPGRSSCAISRTSSRPSCCRVRSAAATRPAPGSIQSRSASSSTAARRPAPSS